MEFISFDRRLVGGGAVLLMLAGLNHFQGLSYVDLRAKDIAVHVVLGLIVYTLVPMYVFDLVYAVKMRAAGCKPAAYYKHRDPIFGVDWVLRMLRGLKACEALQIIQQCFETIGHTFVVKPFGEYVVMTDEPENIKAILSTNFEDWPLAGPRLHTVLGVLGSNSIFSANGKAWQKARAMLRPFFARDQIADLECFDCHISNLINRIPRDGEVFDLQELLYKMTTDSSTDFLLGHSLGMLTDATPEARKFAESFDYSLLASSRAQRLGWLARFMPDRRLTESISYIRACVDKHVLNAKKAEIRTKQQQQGESTDKSSPTPTTRAKAAAGSSSRGGYGFLDELIGSGAPDEYVRDQVLSIMPAGRDTTASALVSLFYELSRRPDVVGKIREEIASLGEPNPDWAQLKGMKYLANVIKEPLRLHSTVPTMSRGAARDTVLPVGGGPEGKDPVFIAQGTPVRWSTWAMHRRRDIFGEDAGEFRPERWENLRSGWEYLPFSGGPRICIGQQFALTQISVVFRFFQTFKAIELRDERPMKQKLAISTSLLNGCLVSVRRA